MATPQKDIHVRRSKMIPVQHEQVFSGPKGVLIGTPPDSPPIRPKLARSLYREVRYDSNRASGSGTTYEVVSRGEKTGNFVNLNGEDAEEPKAPLSQSIRAQFTESADLFLAKFLREPPSYNTPSISDVSFDLNGLMTLMLKGRWRVIPQMADMLVHEYNTNAKFNKDSIEETVIILKTLKAISLLKLRAYHQAQLVLKSVTGTSEMLREAVYNTPVDFNAKNVPFSVYVGYALLYYVCNCEDKDTFHLNKPSMAIFMNLSDYCRREHKNCKGEPKNEGMAELWKVREIWVKLTFVGILVSNKRMNLAISHLNELILFAPSNIQPYYALLKVLLYMGSVPKAESVFKIMKRIFGDEEAVKGVLYRAEVHILHSKGNYGGSEWKREQTSSDIWDINNLGILSFMQDGLESGKAVYEDTIRAMKEKAFSPTFVQNLAFLYNLIPDKYEHQDMDLDTISGAERSYMLQKLVFIYATDEVALEI